MTLVQQLEAAAPAPLKRWLVDAHARVESTIRRAELRASRVTELARALTDEWVKEATFDMPDSINWMQVDDSDVEGSILPDLWDKYEDRLTRNYGLDLDAFRRLLLKELDRRRLALGSGVAIWTDAPKDFDHGYATRTGESLQTGFGKTVYRVVVPTEHQAVYQGQRYGSGLHLAWTDEQANEERERLAKRARLDVHQGAVKALQTEFERAKVLTPAAYDSMAGYWKTGYEDRYELDPKTQRSYRVPGGGPDAPKPDPLAAVAILGKAKHAFEKLPAEVKREHWRLGANIIDVGRLAKREAARKVSEAKAAAKAASEKQKAQDKATADFVRRVEAAGAERPGSDVLVVMEEAQGVYSGGWREAETYGHITAWPPQGGKVETERGRVAVEPFDEKRRGLRLALYPRRLRESVPAAVWLAGASPEVKVVEYEGAPLYVDRGRTSYDPSTVYRATGAKVPKSAKAYRAVVARTDDSSIESQDAILDAAAQRLAERGVHGWTVERLQGLPVQFHPPATPGKGLVGWKARLRATQSGLVGWYNYERMAKPHAKGNNYWQHAEEGAFTSDSAMNEYILNLPKAERDAAREQVVDDPTVTLAQLKARFGEPR